MDQHKEEIQKAFATLLDPQLKWVFQGSGLYASQNLLKQETLLCCDPHRLFTVLSDHHYVTLYRWLPEAREDVTVAESYETDDGCIYRLTNGLVEWIHEERRIVIFPQLPRGLWVKSIDGGKKSFVIEILPKTRAPPWSPLRRAEAICNDTPRFLDIYNPWKCSLCGKMVPAHELYCRACKKERYKRCQDVQCFEAQRRDATKCERCGLSLPKDPLLGEGLK